MAKKFYVGRVAMEYDDEGYSQSDGVSNIVGEFSTLTDVKAECQRLNAEANVENLDDRWAEPKLFKVVEFSDS